MMPFLRHGGAIVARRGGAAIERAMFLGEIAALSAALPERRHVVNFCTDRVRFAAAWAAAMLRGQITLLPADASAASLGALLADFPDLYVLTDAAGPHSTPCPMLRYPALAANRSDDVPEFPPGQVAAVLFTSGSTGRPQAAVRTWGRLVEASLAAGTALLAARHAGAVVVATVPHAHSYGLESAVMLPLQHGLRLDSDRPFFAADVAAALAAEDAPGVLVTTPVQLRSLVGDAAAGDGGPLYAGLVVSATAPLDIGLAAQAEAVFGAQVREIYGCSEAGQIAARRTTEGAAWRCLTGFTLRQDDHGAWACGADGTATPLADEIELLAPDRFILHGRSADLVNVAGKRSSLAYLTGQLTAIEGVTDGVFFARDADERGGVARVAACAVAPGLDENTLLAALRDRIDPAFLPRPLVLTQRLPRNALGKLPRAALLRLSGLAPPQADADAPILLRFPAPHPAAAGHFPGNPVLPGALLLDHLLPALLGEDAAGGTIESVKFHQPVRPGDSLTVTTRTAGSIVRFEARLAGTGQLALSGAARVSSPSP
jgi:acyl-coenzyme A synthetase/AMP-(fatty) acid ligase